MQWSHGVSNPESESCDYFDFYTRPLELETTYEITINIAGSSTAAFGRILGCIMVGFMPDEGLEEAVFSLRDMLEFYGHKPAPQPARLAPKAISASITDHKKRPDLILTE